MQCRNGPLLACNWWRYKIVNPPYYTAIMVVSDIFPRVKGPLVLLLTTTEICGCWEMVVIMKQTQEECKFHIY